MKTSMTFPQTRTLPRKAIDRLPRVQAGTNIVCEKGILWLTCSGDPRDYILFPGDRFARQKRGPVLIQAMRDAVFSIN